MTEATILLPNFNNQNVLPVTFDTLRRNLDCSRVHFVMVDDGSEDDGLAVAKKETARCGFKSVEIIERKHEGIVPTLNACLEAARTECVVRIDGDATVENPGWLPRLVKWLDHAEVGMAGGHVIMESGVIHSLGRSAVSELGLYDMGCAPIEPVGRRTYDSLVYRPKSDFEDGIPYEVDTILGVCVAFRRSEALAAGGFDMRYNPVWIEDDDFGIALRKLGKRIVVDPALHVVHRPSLRGSRKPGDLKAATTARAATRDLARSLKRTARRSLLAGKVLSGTAEKPTLENLLPRESDPWRSNILKGHYQAWKTKWGFDPLNPDLTEIFNRYWESALCWRVNPRLRAESAAFMKKAAAKI